MALVNGVAKKMALQHGRMMVAWCLLSAHSFSRVAVLFVSGGAGGQMLASHLLFCLCRMLLNMPVSSRDILTFGGKGEGKGGMCMPSSTYVIPPPRVY